MSLLTNDYMIANPNLNENHSHLRQAFPDHLVMRSQCVRNAFRMRSQCVRYATQYPLPNTQNPTPKTVNENEIDSHLHQGNLFFSTSGYIELILFYTTINPLYTYRGGTSI